MIDLTIHQIGNIVVHTGYESSPYLTTGWSFTLTHHPVRNVSITPEGSSQIFTEGKDYVILKSGEDFIGCGRISKGKIFNFVPKNRRIP